MIIEIGRQNEDEVIALIWNLREKEMGFSL